MGKVGTVKYTAYLLHASGFLSNKPVVDQQNFIDRRAVTRKSIHTKFQPKLQE